MDPDSRVLQAFDTASTAVILTGAAVGSPGMLTLLGPKNELVKLGGRVLHHLNEKSEGKKGYSRSHLLAAAHTIVLITSYFDVLAEDTTMADVGRLSAKEQALLAADKNAVSSRPLLEILQYAEAPHPAAASNAAEATEAVLQFYARLGDAVAQFVGGLHVFENLKSYQRDYLLHFVRAEVTLEAAISKYHDQLRSLAAEVREFELWVRAFETSDIRTSLDHISLSLRETTQNLNAALQRIAGTNGTADAYQAALVSEREVLTTPPDVQRLNPSGRDIIPALADLYVEPTFRTTQSASADDVSDEHWWRQVPTRTDLSNFVLTMLLADPGSYLSPILVLGHPGAGKSSLMRVIESHLTGTSFVPVRVELRGVGATLGIQEQLEAAIKEKLGTTVLWNDFRQSTAAVPVVMLDGLDELLQASPESRADYLEQVRAFQIQQQPMGGVVVLVTSRTLVANRTRIPTGTVVVKLEDFDEKQAGTFVELWNRHNASSIARGSLHPVPYPLPNATRDLASQPLLLLLVAILYSENAAEFGRVATQTRGDTYRHIIRTFVRREVQKSAPELTLEELEETVDREVLHLAYAAIGMHNRGIQHISGEDLARDLGALKVHVGDGSARRSVTDFFGRFLFVHANTAREGRGQTATAYEFLHATLGEFLVAELACDAVEEAYARAEVLRTSRLGIGDKPDRTASTLLAFESLAARQSVTEFMLERWSGAREGDPNLVVDLLERLMRETIAHPTDDWRDHSYAPVQTGSATRVAYYTSNLLLASAAWAAAQNLRRREFVEVREWQSWTTLWRSQLRPASWDSLLAALRVVVLRDGVRHHVPAIDYQMSSIPAPVHDTGRFTRVVDVASVEVVDRRRDRLEHAFLCLPGELVPSETREPADDELRITLLPHPGETLGGNDLLTALSRCDITTAPMVSHVVATVFASVTITRGWLVANAERVYGAQHAQWLEPGLVEDMVDVLPQLAAELEPEQRVSVGEFLLACEYSGSLFRAFGALLTGLDYEALIADRPDVALRLWEVARQSGYRFVGEPVNDLTFVLDRCDLHVAAMHDPSSVALGVRNARELVLYPWAARRGTVAVADSSPSALRLLTLPDALFLVKAAARDAQGGLEKVLHFGERFAAANRSLNGRVHELARQAGAGEPVPALRALAQALQEAADSAPRG